jgi:hypothetical protein
MEPKFIVSWSSLACTSQTVPIAVRNYNTIRMIQSIVQNGRSSLTFEHHKLILECYWKFESVCDLQSGLSSAIACDSHGTWHTTILSDHCTCCAEYCRSQIYHDFWIVKSCWRLRSYFMSQQSLLFIAVAAAVPQQLFTSGTPSTVISGGGL